MTPQIEVSYILAAAILAAAFVLAALLRKGRNDTGGGPLKAQLDEWRGAESEARSALRVEIERLREAHERDRRSDREERAGEVRALQSALLQRLDGFTGLTDDRFDRLRKTVEEHLRLVSEEQKGQLEHIRLTVDDKLNETLSKRLDSSFSAVAERLEQVHQGLGEMRSLASGVGDLKRILSNVKTRGILGEIQLGALLSELLSPEQFDKDVAIKKGVSERVEYAIRLPGREPSTQVWLPIDAKFPQEDYQRLLESRDAGDLEAAERHLRQLLQQVVLEARKIRDKYVDPPATTDFAILFMPIEGLYQEVLRAPGFWERLQREHQIVLVGPTTLAGFLNSLQMGFRTLAIERRSAEVWKLLGAVKTDFEKFGLILEKTQRKLTEAADTIEDATRKTRTIGRRLRQVEGLPETEALRALEGDGEAPAAGPSDEA